MLFMKRLIYFVLLLSLTSLCLVSCDKEDDPFNPDFRPPVTKQDITINSGDHSMPE